MWREPDVAFCRQPRHGTLGNPANSLTYHVRKSYSLFLVRLFRPVYTLVGEKIVKLLKKVLPWLDMPEGCASLASPICRPAISETALKTRAFT